MSSLNARLADPGYRYWVKAALCIQYLKEGLEKFVEDKSRELHDSVLKEVQNYDNILVQGLCTDGVIRFNPVGKTWSVQNCTCQDCTRCIAVIEQQVVKTGQIFLDPKVQELHDKVLQELGRCGNPSVNGTCAGASLCFNRLRQNKWEVTNCTCHRCQIFIDELSKYRCATLGIYQNTTFTFKQSNFNNSDIQQWHIEHWQLAKLFMNQGQDVATTSPRDTDISGLINFIDHCVVPRVEIGNTQYIEKCREGRNSIIHKAAMTLIEADFLSKTQDMIDLLSDPMSLVQREETQDAVNMINKIRSSDFVITLENETEVLKVLADGIKKMNEALRNEIDVLTTRLEDSEERTLNETAKLRGDIKEQEELSVQVTVSVLSLRNKIKDDKKLQDTLEIQVGKLENLLKENIDQMKLMKDRQDMIEGNQNKLESRQVNIEGRQETIEGRQCLFESRLDEEEKKTTDLTENLRSLSTQVQQSQRPLSTVSEADKDRLRKHLKDGYGVELDVPVLFTCHNLPISNIFVPVIITKDTESSAQEEKSEKPGDTLFHKAGRRTSAPKQKTRESKKICSYKAILFKDNVLQKRIFLLGKAGAGKTTFCQHLVDIWCNDQVSTPFDDAEVLKLFRYLFHVSCRFAEASESIFDMICNQLLCEKDKLKKVASHVLNNTPDECLVVVDGIDEWKDSARTATRRIGDIPGLPSRKGLEDCVVLSTSRPERIHMLPTKLDKKCSVLELHGIQEVSQLICSILREAEYPDPEESCLEFLSQIKQNNLDDLMQFPLMLINALNLWEKNKTLSNSMSVNYSNMMERLFSRAQDANRLEEYEQERRKEISAEVPDCFRDSALCKENAGLIFRLANLAFDLMFSDNQNSSLIFSEQQTSAYLTDIERKTGLDTGILSKAQTTSRSKRKIDSFSFCHKTFQEFLGALWLSIEESELMSMFLRQFRSTTTVLDNKVFLQFLCGLSPGAGDRFWQYIAKEVIEKDEDIGYRLRERDKYGDYRGKNIVRKLQDLILQCIKEARNADLEQHRQLYYFIPDIYIDRNTDERDVTLINGMVKKCVADIKSVTLYSNIPSDIVKSMKKMQSAISIILQGVSYSKTSVPELQFPDQLKLLSVWSVDIPSVIKFPEHLTSLTVYVCKLSHSGIEQLCSYLRVSSTLRSLALSDLSCSDHGYWCCFPVLDLQTHHLTSLIVGDITLSHNGIEQLCSYLRVSSTLRYLRLEFLSCSDHGVRRCLPALDLQTQHLTELIVGDITLSHNAIEQLWSWLSVSSTLRYLDLEKLSCSDHGGRRCLPVLDLQTHHSLETVKLRYLYVESVLLPGQLERQQTGDLHGIPTLDIYMLRVNMSSQGWRSWLDSLPHLPYRLSVKLYDCNIDEDLKSYIRSCSHFTVTKDGTDRCGDNFVFETKQGQ